MVLPELESGLPACLYGTKHAQAQAGAGRHRIGQGPVTKRPIAEILNGRITRFTWRDRHGKMLMLFFSCQFFVMDNAGQCFTSPRWAQWHKMLIYFHMKSTLWRTLLVNFSLKNNLFIIFMNFHVVSNMSNMKVMVHFLKAEFVERL